MDDWKPELKKLFDDLETKHAVKKEKELEQSVENEMFLRDEVRPAFEELKTELEKYGRQVEIRIGSIAGGIQVLYQHKLEFDLSVQFHGGHPYPYERYIDKEGRHGASEGFFRSGSQDYTIKDIKKDELLKYALARYKDALRYRG